MNSFQRALIPNVIICLLLISCQVEKGNLKLHQLFSDHMVLQQNEEVAWWGHYMPQGNVTVRGSWGGEATAMADDQGNWKLNLTTPAAGGPFEVTVVTRDTTAVLHDVLVGEVWLASGQSNMEMPLKGWPPNDPIDNSQREIAEADYGSIRMFTVARNAAKMPVYEVSGSWMVCSPSNAPDFSATAYFFARRLYKELKVPVGVIHSSWGGTPAESWTSTPQLKTLEDFKEVLDKLASQADAGSQQAWFSQWKTLQPQQSSNDINWSSLEFDDQMASQPDSDDSKWLTLELPALWEYAGVQPVKDFDGVIWFRKEIVLDRIEGDYTLSLGAIDDMDMTYLNGQQIGEMVGTGKYNVDRSYAVPQSLLKPGKNMLAIKVIDTGGGGGFSGKADQMTLQPASGTPVSLSGPWKYMPVAEIFDGQVYIYGLEGLDFLKRPSNIVKFTPNTPTALYNGMVHPLVPFTIKGAIWYQGESNVGRAQQYQKLFPAMITDWRQQWGKDFPFYFVQIAPFRYNGNNDPGSDQSQLLRDAQRLSLTEANTGMVVTMDIGNFTNIHPANKQDVGSRLAGLALAQDYGKNLVPSGPLYKSQEKSAKALIIDFDFKGSGLAAKNQELTGFEIAGSDKKYVPATATIVDDRVELSAPGVINPQYARYAWSDNGEASLFNNEGLPASSFTTEH